MFLRTFSIFLICAVAAAQAPFPFGEPRPTGLLRNMAFHYSLDSNNVYVDDIGTNDLTNVGSVVGVAGFINKAPSLNGSSKALTAATNQSLHVTSVVFTVIYWCYTTVSNQAFAGTVGKNQDPSSPFNKDEWRLDYQNGTHTFSVGNSTATRSLVPCTNKQFGSEWAMVAAIRSNNNHLYLAVNNGRNNMIDNGAANTNTQTAAAVNPGCCSFLEIGRVRGGSYFNGLIDDFTMWTNRIMTTYEMGMIWNAGRGGVSRWIAAKKGGQK